MTTQRADYWSLAPEAFNALGGVNAALARSSLGPQLLELVFQRASQINGCAFCLDMHARKMLQDGEDLQRLFLLETWREAEHLFSARERAALAWTESITNIKDSRAPDEDYQALQQQFSDKEIVELTFAIGVINTWNRLSIGLRKQPDGVPYPLPESVAA